ncbi:MAG: glycosyltransferase [Candidatus Omnitrophica bacterium]|nr:glycosyltransferase [Candidatus Omnitrophota bacterium]
MKILLTNYRLTMLGGSELFTWDIARELAKNNEVFIYSPFCGDVAQKMQKSGLIVIDNLGKIKSEKPDIIHAHHNIPALQARHFFPEVPMIFLSHGIIPFLETPPSIDINIQMYLAVSEEVKLNLISKNIPAEKIRIFRNFADTEKFRPITPINEKLKKVLIIASHVDGKTLNLIKKTCRKLNLKLDVIGKTAKCVWDVEKYINNADLVVALGRSAIEAMSCGRVVMVYGNSAGVIGGDGIITEDNVEELEKNNFSGRRYNLVYTLENFINEFLKYKPEIGFNNRKIVLTYFNLKDRIDELLKIYRHCCYSTPSCGLFIPEKEIAYLIKETKTVEIMQQCVMQKEHELQKILASKSWKITAPFRWTKKTIAEVNRKFKRTFSFVDGIINIIDPGKIKKTFITIKQQGLRPLAKKISVEVQSFNTYKAWIEQNGNKAISYQKNTKFAYAPRISIIITVFNPPLRILKSTLNSVLNQTYANWELCIADARSNNNVKKILEEYAKKDARIKVVFLEENKGIAGNLNEALKIASGEFIGFVDHDDELHLSAAYEIIQLLNTNNDIDFIYTDEDKLSIMGKRFSPHFKPDWSPDMLRSFNYIGHFAVIRKNVIDKIGGFKIELEYKGSQDYDLLLRLSEQTQKIEHIPKVLYHYRARKCQNADKTKRVVPENAQKVLSEHIHRLGLKGKVDFTDFSGHYRIRYAIDNNPAVSIIIPNKDNLDKFRKCISSVLNKSTYKNYEIFIVDNQSAGKEIFEYYEELRKTHKIRILNHNKPFNFSAVNNYAVPLVGSEYLIFLNNDTEVITPSWIESMLEFAQRSDVGAVGAKLYYPNDTIQHAGVIIWNNGMINHAFRNFHKNQPGYMARTAIIQNYSAVTAACMMTKKSIFNEVGGFNENFAVYYNDIDFCLRIREKGYLIIWTPYAELYHHESHTIGRNMTEEKGKTLERECLLCRKKWGSIFKKGDPYYNPNLSLTKEDFSLRSIR